jgi:hypothetical protein
MHFTEHEEDVLGTVNIAISSVSLLASLSILCAIRLFPRLHGLTYNAVAFASVGDVLYAVGGLIGKHLSGDMCTLQAMLLSFGSLASVVCLCLSISPAFALEI